MLRGRKLRKYVWARDRSNGCFCCSNSFKKEIFHLGHILPRKHGGSLDPGNLVALCPRCNLAMGSLHLVEYMIMTRQNLAKIRKHPLFPYYRAKHRIIAKALRRLSRLQEKIPKTQLRKFRHALTNTRYSRRWEEVSVKILNL